MSVDPLGLLILVLGIVALFRGPSFAFTIFIPTTLLGSAAAIASDTITIQPAHLLLGFLTVIVFSRRRYLDLALQGLSFPLPGFWLVYTLIYGVVGAFLFPRILAGMTSINAIGRSDSGLVFHAIPLGPTSGNFTQSVYFCGDVICFLLCYSFASTTAGFRCIFRALIYYGIGNIVFAVLDLATFWTGTGFLLDFIRNSSYALHTETEVLGLKRIVGSFTETSSFAYATLGVLGFTGRLWLFNIFPALTFPIALASLLLLLFSTSSTAYVALPLILFYLYFHSAWKFLKGRAPVQTMAFVIMAPLFLVLIVIAVLLQPSIADSINGLMDVLIFEKSTSQSGIERGIWNEMALANFFDTYGLGAGIGSVRASSFAIAMLANLGVFGTLTFCAFLYKMMAVPNHPSDELITNIGRAARTAWLALLCSSLVSGALTDLSLPFFVFAGLSCAMPLPEPAAYSLQPTLRDSPV